LVARGEYDWFANFCRIYLVSVNPINVVFYGTIRIHTQSVAIFLVTKETQSLGFHFAVHVTQPLLVQPAAVMKGIETQCASDWVTANHVSVGVILHNRHVTVTVVVFDFELESWLAGGIKENVG
jgi:hypothetical protein